MYLNRIDIRAFRSLYDVSFRPGQFTVLAGPNNAGKSTLAEALHFLAEAHLLGLEYAINRNGGFENVAHRRVRRTRQPIAFDVRATLSAREVPPLMREIHGVTSRLTGERFRERYGVSRRDFDADLSIRHVFSFKAMGEAIASDFAVLDESVELSVTQKNDLIEQALFSFMRETESLTIVHVDEDKAHDPIWRRAIIPFGSEDVLGYVTENLQPTNLIVGTSTFNSVLRTFSQALARIHLYQLTPPECRLPGSPTPNAELGQHGANLPALVAHMTRHAPDSWRRTLEAMRSILPGLIDIKTIFTPDRRLTIQFLEEGGGRGWTPEEVSDGTIRSLALFLSLYDPRQRLVIIEEPENSLHPWIVRAFIDACREAIDKQIIVTTHSPALLSYVKPSEVTLVWRRDGRSHVKPLIEVDPDSERLWDEGAVNVFDILDGGFVRESVPEGYV